MHRNLELDVLLCVSLNCTLALLNTKQSNVSFLALRSICAYFEPIWVDIGYCFIGLEVEEVGLLRFGVIFSLEGIFLVKKG